MVSFDVPLHFFNEIGNADIVRCPLPEDLGIGVVESQYEAVDDVLGLLYFIVVVLKDVLHARKVCLHDTEFALKQYIELVADVALSDNVLIFFHSKYLDTLNELDVGFLRVGFLELVEEFVALQEAAEDQEAFFGSLFWILVEYLYDLLLEQKFGLRVGFRIG